MGICQFRFELNFSQPKSPYRQAMSPVVFDHSTFCPDDSFHCCSILSIRPDPFATLLIYRTAFCEMSLDKTLAESFCGSARNAICLR